MINALEAVAIFFSCAAITGLLYVLFSRLADYYRLKIKLINLSIKYYEKQLKETTLLEGE